MSNGFTTVPINVIADASASLTYFNTTKYPIPGNIYVLQDNSGGNVSDFFSKNTESINYSTNASSGNFDASNSYIINDGANNLYSTFKTSLDASFGFIQITNTDGLSNSFFQFSSTVPTNATANYPTGIAYDLSNGFIFMTSSSNNSVYKITDASAPTTYYSLVSDLSFNIGLSGINSLAFDLNYNLYVSSINSPYHVAKIDTDASASVLTSFSGPSYGLATDLSNNLYIGLQDGKVAKIDLSSNIITNPFITLDNSSNILDIYYNSFTNTLFLNTSSLTIYSFNLSSNTGNFISSNSGISCGFVPDSNDSRIFYGANNTNIKELSLPEEYYFSNMLLKNTGLNTLTVFNTSTSSSVGLVNVFVYTSNSVFYRSTINGNLTDLSQIFNLYSIGDKAIETGYKVGSQDLNDIFEKKTSGIFAPVTGYTVVDQTTSTIKDLNQLFNPIPSYIISSKSSNMLTTEFTSLYYNVIIFENTLGPQFPNNPLVSSATCLVNINLDVSLNIVIIGGGGGGSAGNSGCAGGGGGGSAVIYYPNLYVSKNSILTITVGVNGGGRQVSNPGKGNSGGAGGNTSSVNITLNGFQTAYLEANGGGAGLGIGTASGYGGGPSGSATNTLGNTGGGGGGTGGGASESPPGAASISYGNGTNQSPGKLNGILSTSGGQGTNGGSSDGGTGGNVFSDVSAVSLPWAPGFYIYAGNGGGGGSFGAGGAAGYTTGGAGGGSGSTNGGNAQFYYQTQGDQLLYAKNYYYGSGGGGGAQTSPNFGGSGSKAVVMIWYS